MRNFLNVAVCVTAVAATACGSDDVDSDEEARRAYLCLDKSIGKSLTLGFAGFNAASSANIDPQMVAGDAGGTLTITGQVDQGASDNKGLRLYVGMVDYDDGPVPYNDDGDEVHVIFDTPAEQMNQPYLDLKLMNFPDGTLTGTLTSNTSGAGVYLLDGDIEGELTLNLTINGVTMAGAVAGDVVRVPGMTTITGTAKSSEGGTYEINITI